MRSLSGKARSDGGANAARGAGDQRDLAGEAAGRQSSLQTGRRRMAINAKMLSSAVAIR
jgi:hypothetical protein